MLGNLLACSGHQNAVEPVDLTPQSDGPVVFDSGWDGNGGHDPLRTDVFLLVVEAATRENYFEQLTLRPEKETFISRTTTRKKDIYHTELHHHTVDVFWKTWQRRIDHTTASSKLPFFKGPENRKKLVEVKGYKTRLSLDH